MHTAVIREEECIGCSKCIPACPVDAILGTHKFLHTVLLDECIGCGLCVAPCPVDCIDMVPLAQMLPEQQEINKPERAKRAKLRHKARQIRLHQEVQRQLPIFADRTSKQEHIRQDLQAILTRSKSKIHAESHS
jgi:electron transport complex protein RnfB